MPNCDLYVFPLLMANLRLILCNVRTMDACLQHDILLVVLILLIHVRLALELFILSHCWTRKLVEIVSLFLYFVCFFLQNGLSLCRCVSIFMAYQTACCFYMTITKLHLNSILAWVETQCFEIHLYWHETLLFIIICNVKDDLMQ